MDVDILKSSSGEEHMDMMTMMLQMEKLPDFCSEPFHNTTNTSTILQQIQFSNENPTSIVASPPIYHDNPHASPPPFINPPPCSVPCMGAPIQEPMTPPLDQHNMMASKFKYSTPFSNANSFLSAIEKKNSTAAIREMTFQQAGANIPNGGFGFTGVTMPNVGYSSSVKNCQPAANMVATMQMLR
ncbi:hypothetical protein D5086_014801 [Populus alba]|uniref:Uncharacterized protein n=1 Tax=Populus alba TaxID=43335 RepID=A0ACC4BZB1_POPAL